MVKNGIYPNYILLGSSGVAMSELETLVSSIKTIYPERFEGNSDCFTFELRYVEPFNNFLELKRLQCIAAKEAGRKSDFKGLIILDMNSWRNHVDEKFFKIALMFLADMSDCWSYIMLVDNKAGAKELIGAIMAVWYQSNIPCNVMELVSEHSGDSLNHICESLDIACSLPVMEVLQDFMNLKNFDEKMLAALICELSWQFPKQIVGLKNLSDFIHNKPTVKYLMKSTEYQILCDFIDKKMEELSYEKTI